ncbi:MAG: radical SAM protein [Acidobacteriaceae bacterium]
MKAQEILQSWSTILGGRKPLMSIEITRECPLRCPGCYAYDEAHLGGNGVTLRVLSDYKKDALVKGVLDLVDQYRPRHVSLVGGDPMVRFRELEQILPALEARGIHTQLVTSAFRPIPQHWSELSRLNIVVSIDGLQPDHDARRKPATYERIQENIRGQHITIHFTVTGQIARQQNYFERFLDFWSRKPEIKRIWISLFTPQMGATGPEILSPEERTHVIDEIERLLPRYPVVDISPRVLSEFRRPPQSPEDCIFAQTTRVISADLKTRVIPCQFGGNPDCSQCGCMASMGLAAVGHLRVGAGVNLGQIYAVSRRIGSGVIKIINIENDNNRNTRKEVA